MLNSAVGVNAAVGVFHQVKIIIRRCWCFHQ